MEELIVFYDGACRLCYREISHYKKRDDHNLLKLVDISSESFRAQDYGLIDEEVNLHMHAMGPDGQVFKGVDSFVEIWKRIPPYEKLIPVFENKRLRPLIDKGYHVFAKFIRPNLPKRDCEEGTCSI